MVSRLFIIFLIVFFPTLKAQRIVEKQLLDQMSTAINLSEYSGINSVIIAKKADVLYDAFIQTSQVSETYEVFILIKGSGLISGFQQNYFAYRLNAPP